MSPDAFLKGKVSDGRSALPWSPHGYLVAALSGLEGVGAVTSVDAGLVAAMVVVFTVAYVNFQRQEIRA
jgi:hypothetical protein